MHERLWGLPANPTAARISVRAVVLLVAALSFSGCVTSNIEQFKGANTGVNEGENVVILARQHHNTHEAEESFTQCVASSLHNRQNGIGVVSSEEFINALYPWFEPSIAPLGVEELRGLLGRHGVADRLAANGVRYVVWLDGNTEQIDGGGGMSCALGPAMGGCYGLTWWVTGANYEVNVWDVHNVGAAGTITTDVTGRSVVPAVVVPLPFIAPTRSSACRGLANQLEEFLVVEGGISE